MKLRKLQMLNKQQKTNEKGMFYHSFFVIIFLVKEMKLCLNKCVKIDSAKNLDEIDLYIENQLKDKNEICYKKITGMRNHSDLIRHYIFKIRESTKEINLIFNNKKIYLCAQMIYESMHPKKIKVGLALAGGGARGAYQMGVLEVMNDFHLLDNIDVKIGTSIGAYSMIFLEEYGIEKSKEIWNKLDSKVVLTKNKFKDFLSKRAVYSREETKVFLEKYVKNEKMISSKTEMYVQNLIFPSLQTEQVKINSFNKEKLIDVLIATSSLPFVFGYSKFDGKKYIDSGLKDNDGIDFLIKQGCNIILYISLRKEDVAKKKSKDGVCLIDWGSCHYYPGMVKGLVDFYPEKSKYKIEYGHEVASLMIEKLKSEGIYEILKNRRVEDFYKLPKFIRLDKNENTIKFKF